jgi:putative endonuclease
MATRSRKVLAGFFGGWQPIWRIADYFRQRKEQSLLSPPQAMGRTGEDLAHRYLRKAGFEILARRYRLSDGSGEVDIVARDETTLVFVEVKTRQTSDYGAPERAVGYEKEQHNVKAARSYALRAGADWNTVRFDIIAIVLTNPPSITHLRDAFHPYRRI